VTAGGPGDEPDEKPDEPRGTISPTGPGPLVIGGVVGLVLGWAVRPLCLRLGYAEPDISLVTVGVLFFAAAIVGGSAYLTKRTVERHRSALEHHQAVNRLVLAKACALVGAFLAGGYLGYAVAQLGVGDPASDTRLWRSSLAALGALAATAAALLLEQACRVPRRPE
jgi:cytochrome bd-type quinol oxidase subunit 2